MPRPRFHLAIPSCDLAASRRFYGELLGCAAGRSTETWADFDFFGHQLSVHHDPAGAERVSTNPVDGKDVPVRHFGAILDRAAWEALAERFRDAGIEFLVEPTIRFEGCPGEQRTLFVRDPSGNALEFKSFTEPDQVFAA